MPFNFHELSRWMGRPEHLFIFSRQHMVWRYTSGDRSIIISDDTYIPAAISRSSVRDTSERAKNQLTITVPYSANPLASDAPPTQVIGEQFRPYPPGDPVYVTCLSVHRNDSDMQTVVEWMGRVMQPRFTDTTLELTCEQSRSRTRFSGLTQRWMRGCPLVLYSQGLGMCNVSLTSHGLSAVVATVDSLTLTAPEFGMFPDGRLAGGYIEWVRDDGFIERRTVMSHNNTTIVIHYGALDLAAGISVMVYPGCAHNWSDCIGYFSNQSNYGGCVFLPVDNPFDRSLAS